MSDESFLEKMRSVNFAGKKRGKSEVKPKVADDGERRGKVVGKEIHHWDGRVDAVATVPTVSVETSVREIG